MNFSAFHCSERHLTYWLTLDCEICNEIFKVNRCKIEGGGRETQTKILHLKKKRFLGNGEWWGTGKISDHLILHPKKKLTSQSKEDKFKKPMNILIKLGVSGTPQSEQV